MRCVRSSKKAFTSERMFKCAAASLSNAEAVSQERLHFLKVAHAVADAAADETMKRFRKQGSLAAAKGDGSPVTEADRAAEHAMRDVIRVCRLILFHERNNCAIKYWYLMREMLYNTPSCMRVCMIGM